MKKVGVEMSATEILVAQAVAREKLSPEERRKQEERDRKLQEEWRESRRQHNFERFREKALRPARAVCWRLLTALQAVEKQKAGHGDR